MSIGCVTTNFTISSSGEYGYVHRYGIYENLDLLEFSTSLPPAYFCFTTNGALQELKSGKCAGRVNSYNYQLTLTYKVCNDEAFFEEWKYDSTKQQLVDTDLGLCFNPWYYFKQPTDVQVVPKLSDCSESDPIILRPSKHHILRFLVQGFNSFFDLSTIPTLVK